MGGSSKRSQAAKKQTRPLAADKNAAHGENRGKKLQADKAPAGRKKGHNADFALAANSISERNVLVSQPRSNAPSHWRQPRFAATMDAHTSEWSAPE